MESIISAILAGAVTLIGVLIANGKSQAVTDTKLEELTREVREHNNFARRVPILEEQMKVANHRIADLEKERMDCLHVARYNFGRYLFHCELLQNVGHGGFGR